MIKFKLMFDKDAEQSWLNELSLRGKAMTGFFAGFYSFEETEPGKWSYQIDFSDRFGKVSEDYRSFMKEMEIEIVKVWGFWVILRKPATDGEFKLFTDVDSRLAHYKKIRTLFCVTAILELILFCMEAVATFVLNEPLAFIPMLLLGILTVTLIQQTKRTDNIISELREQKRETCGSAGQKKQRVSPVLLFGMLLNLCSLCIDPDTASESMHNIRLITQLIAIATMIVGIYQTRWVFGKK